jgi:hypothetical protein
MEDILLGIGGFALVAAAVLMYGIFRPEDKENYTALPNVKIKTPMPEVKVSKRSHHKKKVA